jgi:hypothetical protein
MKRWRISSGLVMVAGMLLEQGCLFKKSPPKASIVIPPAPQAKPPQPMPPPPQLPPSDAKPVVKSTPLPTLPPPVTVPVKPKPKPSRKTVPPVVSPEVETPPPAQTPPVIVSPGPSLQPILGAKEVQERTQRIQQYLEKARLVVLRAERSNPDAKTKELIAQVRTFLQQAEDARRVDLVRAENLAERAEVLSRGLAR